MPISFPSFPRQGRFLLAYTLSALELSSWHALTLNCPNNVTIATRDVTDEVSEVQDYATTHIESAGTKF